MQKMICLAIFAAMPSLAHAQTKEMIDRVEGNLGSLRFVASLFDAKSGAYRPDPKGQPSLRATNAALRSWKYFKGDALGAKLQGKAATSEYVLKCYDPVTGGFADSPSGKADVMTTAVGIMAAVECRIPQGQFSKSMDYLKDNAKTFEEARLAAGAVEAWGVKECPIPLKPWFDIADKVALPGKDVDAKDAVRELASVTAMFVRLGREVEGRQSVTDRILAGQRSDGGFGKPKAKASDLDTTYRVMRAIHLLKAKPKEPAKLRDFIAKCRNADGGYGTIPGEKSSASGTYYAAIVSHWLDEGK